MKLIQYKKIVQDYLSPEDISIGQRDLSPEDISIGQRDLSSHDVHTEVEFKLLSRFLCTILSCGLSKIRSCGLCTI